MVLQFDGSLLVLDLVFQDLEGFMSDFVVGFLSLFWSDFVVGFVSLWFLTVSIVLCGAF